MVNVPSVFEPLKFYYSYVSAMANLKGTHTPMHVLKKVENGKMKPLDSISELISNINITEI